VIEVRLVLEGLLQGMLEQRQGRLQRMVMIDGRFRLFQPA